MVCTMLGTCSACGFSPGNINPTSPEYHRLHRKQHLARFPNVDQQTRDALDRMVELAEDGAFEMAVAS